MFRIRALIDIPDIGVSKGDLGGLVEKEENLCNDPETLCWIGQDAQVFGEGRVECDAQIRDHAKIFGEAAVCDDAVVMEYAQVSGDSLVQNNSCISGCAEIDSAHIMGWSCIEDATVKNGALVDDVDLIGEDVHVSGPIELRSQTDEAVKISGNIFIESPLAT